MPPACTEPISCTNNSCRLCGRLGILEYAGLRDRTFQAEGCLNLWRCSGCGLRWANRFPSGEDRAGAYAGYHTHEEMPERRLGPFRQWFKDGLVAHHMGYRRAGVGTLALAAGRMLAVVEPLREGIELETMTFPASATGRILDVGCGSGAFMGHMKSLGWDVMGIEPDSVARESAARRWGLKICSDFHDAALAQESVDAVTLNHVIEHVDDPVATLGHCFGVLKLGGKIALITPNYEGLGHTVWRRHWYGLDPPRHLWGFNANSLRTLAQQARFHVSRLATTARQARWHWLLSVEIAGRGRVHWPPAGRTALWRPDGWLFEVLERLLCRFAPLGEEIVLIGEKRAGQA